MWWKLTRSEIKSLPNLGQIQGDFKTFDDLLAHATGTHTTVANFLFETTHTLRDKGHGRTAEKYGVSDSQSRVKQDIEVCNWRPAMIFSHLLIPCGIAEVSSKQDKGITRLCLPFIQTETGPNPEDAITSLCSLAWFLAYHLENALVEKARLCRVTHKMRVVEDDGDLWFNKSCHSARMATCIKIDRKSVVYMYVGGGAVDHDQSQIFGGLVVVCKSWKWAAMIYTAARIAGLSSSNYFGNIDQEMVISADDVDTDNTASALQPKCEFPIMCEEVWTRLRTTPGFLMKRFPTYPSRTTCATINPVSPTS